MRPVVPRAIFLAALLLSPLAPAEDLVRLEGRILDAATSAPLPARLHIEGSGKAYLARVESPGGSAVTYEKRRGDSSEVHTTLSAHPFAADVPPGSYTLTAERGKEYLAETVAVEVRAGAAPVTIRLRRWIDMAGLGWYSGDTHVHRGLEELSNLLLAEDLNIAFPLVHWVTQAFTAPSAGDRSAAEATGPEPITVDPTHVICPRNTEYEIFTVDGKRHELGAFFLLHHRTVFDRGVPPVRPIAERAHAEGGLIELDKHCWPWSMALVPVMKVDLYELSNNHVWRTRFGFQGWGEPAAEYMRIERDQKGWTERGWIDYGFQNYYALLDCGFRLRPTAGTASGVHPVPLGFSRVYVRVAGRFTAESWLRRLDEGASFVTTGPMLFAEVVRDDPGSPTTLPGATRCSVRGKVVSADPIRSVEVVKNGEVAASLAPDPRRTPEGAHEAAFDVAVPLDGSSWIAVRAFAETAGGRIRFAHGAPVHIDIPGKPLRPRREEAEYLVRRVADQIRRSEGVLPPEAIEEYREALRAYEEAARNAR